MLSRVLSIFCLLVILGVPLGARLLTTDAKVDRDARPLVIITPHVPQIRYEFAQAFEAWHKRVHGEAVRVDWRSPGVGTTELLKILEAQFSAAISDGRVDLSDPKNPKAQAGSLAFDLMFGGGTFDHGRLKTGLAFGVGDAKVQVSMSVPAGLDEQSLAKMMGDNVIGAGQLYDPQQYWIGTALSGFGIVYNRDVLQELGVPEPTDFADLTNPKLVGTLILADPRQSGSIATTLDAILNATVWNAARAQGWDGALREAMAKESKDKTPWEKSLSPEHLALAQEAFASGWRMLREMTANTRGYTAAATKPPIDISAGEGAAGLAIDFYGRSQAQFVLAVGEDPSSGRVGYVDPKGSAYIDADPVSMLRGGPDPELAKRFIEFCLTEEAQLLWQLPSQRSPAGKSNPMIDGIASGPRRYELRRMPVRRDMYASFGERFIDKVDPFQIAASNRPVGWRDVMRDMFGAFAVDNADLQREAWKSLQRAKAGGVSPETLAQMEQAFYAWPVTTVSVKQADGEATRQELEFHVSTIRAIRGVRADRAAWPRVEIAWTTFFRDQYRRVIELGRSGR